MPSFFNGKRFFLTYPQCNNSKESLLDFLKSRAPVKYAVVSREKHQDDNFHLHACVEFKDHQRQSVSWLDFQEKHPNIQSPRNWNASKTYVKKEGDFIEFVDGENALVDLSAEGSLQEKCFSFDKEEDWYEYCASNGIAFQYCQYFWNRLNADSCTILNSTIVIGQLCPALETFQFPRDCRKSLIIKGPSGCGKTTWAKRNMPLPALFVSHVDQLKMFRAGKII